MFDMSSKAMRQADEFLRYERMERIKDTVVIDDKERYRQRKRNEIYHFWRYWTEPKTFCNYFKGSFRDWVRFCRSINPNTGREHACAICTYQFKPTLTAEQIYESYMKNRAKTHYRGQEC